MATVDIDVVKLVRGVYTYTWTPLANGDDGGPIDPNKGAQIFADKTVHVYGNFGTGGTLVVQGSNDGTQWVTLNDHVGTAISLTALGLVAIAENPAYIRPFISAGTGVSLTCIISARGIFIR